MQKRSFGDEDGDGGTGKRAKLETSSTSSTLVATSQTSTALTTVQSDGRCSSLMAPEVTLHGHEGSVFSIAFDPSGQQLCSGGLDKKILLWDVLDECKNYNTLTGHRNAILQVLWPTPTGIISCSADKTVACWDANKGTRVRKLVEHTAIVNAVAVARDMPHFIASGSDDCTVILWDNRQKQSVGSMYHDYQVLSVAMSADGQTIYSAGIDNVIRRFDVRNFEQPDLTLEGHGDSITGLSLSPDEKHLLSNAMDGTLRSWDVRPFAEGHSRCECVTGGVHHGAEKLLLRCGWSPDQAMVSAGSADRLVHTWDAHTFQAMPCWPGHKASVNEVIFHPTQRILASCSSDRTIILGELPAP